MKVKVVSPGREEEGVAGTVSGGKPGFGCLRVMGMEGGQWSADKIIICIYIDVY